MFAFVAPKLVGAATGYAAGQSLRTRNSDSGTLSARQIAAMWKMVESDPTMGSFFRRFKDNFPADYASLQVDFTRHLQSSSDRTADSKFAFDWMQSFITRNAASFMRGSTEALDAYADEALEIAKVLQREDLAKCAAFVMDGKMTPANSASQALKTHVANASSIVLAAIASGRVSGQLRGEPTETQSTALYEAIVAQGANEQALQTLLDGSTQQLSFADQCAVGVAISAAIAQMPPQESAFWVAYNASQTTGTR